jgi:hypothetical protein
VIRKWIFVAGAAAAVAWSALAPAQPSVVKTEVSGTAFRLTLSDGSIRQGLDLVGAVMTFDITGELVRVRIASIALDPNDSSVLLHDFRIQDTGASMCSRDPDGRQAGFPLVGRTAADGRFLDAEPDVFELTCTSGAHGKCVRFGYHPWKQAEDGTSMRRYHDACVRMMRADYCGDGRSWTKDGTLIDLWDDRGIQRSDTTSDPTFSFEAGWSSEGAVCVARTRIPDALTLDRLAAICPRLSGAQRCTEAIARHEGALLFNRVR